MKYLFLLLALVSCQRAQQIPPIKYDPKAVFNIALVVRSAHDCAYPKGDSSIVVFNDNCELIFHMKRTGEIIYDKTRTKEIAEIIFTAFVDVSAEK